MQYSRFLLPIALALIAEAPARSESAVAVTLDVKAGTASGDVSTAALNANDNNIQITIKNSTGVAWHDLHVEFIKKGSSEATNPSIGGGTLENPSGGAHTGSDSAPDSVSGGEAVSFPAGGGQHEFGPKFTGGAETLTCTLTDCDGGENQTNSVRATPSVLVSSEESNLFGTYDLSVSTDLIRSGNGATWHGQVIGRVINRDMNETLIQLDGAMTLPAGISLSGVTVRSNEDGYPLVSGASVTQNGTDFQVTGLSMDLNEEVLVVADLSAAVNGGETKMLLEATFDV